MKHSLNLEFVGENRHYEISMHKKHGLIPPRHLFKLLPRRPWVAEVTFNKMNCCLERRFLRGTKDYSESNGSASRGVHLHFILEDSKIYEVHEPLGWKKFDRYFLRFNGYEKEMLTREGVIRCLSVRSA